MILDNRGIESTSNRRQLLRMAAWLLPVLAASRLQPQKRSTSETSENAPQAQTIHIWSGFLTGNAFRELALAEKTAYLEGIWDGYVFALSFAGKPPAAVKALFNCIPHLQNEQLLAIVNKYMQERPERWGDPIGLIVYNTVPKECWEF